MAFFSAMRLRSNSSIWLLIRFIGSSIRASSSLTCDSKALYGIMKDFLTSSFLSFTDFLSFRRLATVALASFLESSVNSMFLYSSSPFFNTSLISSKLKPITPFFWSTNTLISCIFKILYFHTYLSICIILE